MIRFPISPNVAADLLPLFREGLRLSQVSAGEAVIIYADTLSNPQYPAAFLAAAKDLGAQAFQIIQSAMPFDLEKPMGRATPTPLIIEAMKKADFVLDISTGGMLYSNEQTDNIGDRNSHFAGARARRLSAAPIAERGGARSRHPRRGALRGGIRSSSYLRRGDSILPCKAATVVSPSSMAWPTSLAAGTTGRPGS